MAHSLDGGRDCLRRKSKVRYNCCVPGTKFPKEYIVRVQVSVEHLVPMEVRHALGHVQGEMNPQCPRKVRLALDEVLQYATIDIL